MKKYFDITAKKARYNKNIFINIFKIINNKQKKISPKTLILTIICVLFLINVIISSKNVFSFWPINLINSNPNIYSNQKSNDLNENSNDKILITNTPMLPVPKNIESSATKNDTISKNIKVLNGSGKAIFLVSAQNILNDNSFGITSSGSTKNQYSQTTIYYNNSIEHAKSVAKIFSNIKPKLLKSSAITGKYDAVVVIGKDYKE